MDLKAKHAELTAEIEATDALRLRALQSADQAALQLAALRGALGIVNELLRDKGDGHA